MENKYTPPPAYPLKWPDGRSRTLEFRREDPRFKTTLEQARILLGDEIKRLGGRLPVLTTNVELRLDGYPYSNRRPPSDSGAAVYFQYKGKSVCFACDRWRKVEHNVKAIAKTIEAIRGIARWGTGDMLERSVSAFEALPDPGHFDWRAELGMPQSDEVTAAHVRSKFSDLAKMHHPDQGGNPDKFRRLIKARDIALKELEN